MTTQVVDFGEQAEHVDEYLTHPAGYVGVFKVSQDAAKVERDGDVIAVDFLGTVDGANVREYLARYRDKTSGKVGFTPWRVAAVLLGFGLRKHGDTVNPTRLLDIKAGMTAPVRLKVHAYGKCKSCGKYDAALADRTVCRCGGAVDRRTCNVVDRWLAPDAVPSNAAEDGGHDADQWG